MDKNWYKYFKKNVYGKCQLCNNKIRVSQDISKILKINDYKNLKFPHVFWCDNIPICYYCNSLGNSINEINTKKRKKYNYLSNWYKYNKYCYYGSNNIKLCGNKYIYSDGLCKKHYIELHEGRILKKNKIMW